jgi:hypothetical protein
VSSSVAGMTNFHQSLSPRPGTIKDINHQFKMNEEAEGIGPGTYESFWNVYIYGTRFNRELDDSPWPTTYNTISIKMGDIGDFGNFCCF